MGNLPAAGDCRPLSGRSAFVFDWFNALPFSLWTVFAAIDLLSAVGMGVLLLWCDLRMPLLKRTPAPAREVWPSISIVVAARTARARLSRAADHGRE
jgi:hypothetical protein